MDDKPNMTAVLQFGEKSMSVPRTEFPITLEFNGKEYRIRITINGRLIME